MAGIAPFLAANLFALLALVVAGFQLGLALGRPWGHLTMGGRHPGVLPMVLRLSALIFCVLWVGMGWLVLAHVGAIHTGPTPGILPVLALCFVTMVLNLITPSKEERHLWGPVTIVMVLCLSLIWFLTH